MSEWVSLCVYMRLARMYVHICEAFVQVSERQSTPVCLIYVHSLERWWSTTTTTTTTMHNINQHQLRELKKRETEPNTYTHDIIARLLHELCRRNKWSAFEIVWEPNIRQSTEHICTIATSTHIQCKLHTHAQTNINSLKTCSWAERKHSHAVAIQV